MTYAPQNLMDARQLLIAEFNMNPGTVHTDLEPAEVGIVGNLETHDGGYHCGWDRRRIRNGMLADYSWTESPRDATHKTNAARGLDIGWFEKQYGATKVNLYDLTWWMVEECKKGAPDTLYIREIIYTLDGKVVKRWDRLGRRTTGDLSHLAHTHRSDFADSEFVDKTGLFRRFITEVGGPDMLPIERLKLDQLEVRVAALVKGTDASGVPTGGSNPTHVSETNVTAARVAAIETTLLELASRPAAQVTLSTADIQALATEVALAVSQVIKPMLSQAAFEGAQRAEDE